MALIRAVEDQSLAAMDIAAHSFVSGAESASKREKAADTAEDGQLAGKKIAVSGEAGRYDGAARLYMLPDQGRRYFV